jgi:hypothetical protein
VTRRAIHIRVSAQLPGIHPATAPRTSRRVPEGAPDGNMVVVVVVMMMMMMMMMMIR